MSDAPDNVVIENAQILFPNFSGREGRFNQPGDRNFCVILDQKTAKTMVKDGWNVKFPKPGDDDEEDTRDPYIQVTLKYGFRPPKILMITSTGRTYLTEDMVEILDSMEFSNVDLIINPSIWEVNGKSGIKAYLKSLYVTIEEDELERKYAVAEDA
jgi:hypothetical protein